MIRLFNTSVTLLICAASLFCTEAAPELPADMQQLAADCITGVYRNTFKTAEDAAKKIIKKYPDHPAGYFFYAVTIKAWMDYYNSNKRENDFYAYCDQAIDKGEQMRDRGERAGWATFFIGGAEGYKATYEADNERWITSFRHACRGISILNGLYKADPSFKDCCFGLGKYDYWRSALSGTLWWLPVIDDRRQAGIKRLFEAMQAGHYTREAAAEELVGILCREKQYEAALKICNSFLEQYPYSLFFLWEKAQTLWGMQRYEETEKTYRYILSGVEAENFDNHLSAIICHYWLAKVYLQTGRLMQCVAECNRMEYYKLSDEVAPRAREYLTKSAALRKQAQAAIRR